ncbi:MAG TPA: FliH/SctL family protein [Acidocella sp.]|uniref:FliH/SctL family protein n=1 Tax=Acidocella sp. TaxID=50710 RepID=UPI002C34B105|nr:FliH/SctL family protein [Acidocella sp.]HVE22001.1 FliH/SctL family protein [Acidocella sp.]
MSYVITRRQAQNAVPAESAVDVFAETVERRVSEEIARLRVAAEAEGQAAGEQAGHAAAQAQTASQAAPAIKALETAWSQLSAPLRQREHDLAALVTDLAFQLARHIVGVEVTTNVEGLRALVTQLLQEAASERTAHQRIVVRLHPADHAVLAPLLVLEDGKLISDAAVSRGGAMVELSAPEGDPLNRIEWDARIEARIASVRAALGLRDEAAA